MRILLLLSIVEIAVPKLATNCGDVNIALRRDHSNVMLSGHPQVCDLTRGRIVNHKRVRNRVEQWLQILAKFLLSLEELSPRAI